jgi:bifunctional enzyme CysN/CysC
MQTETAPHSPEDTQPVAGVIWITGYSGAGKTTVARKVQQRLTSAGVRVVLLDGDDLRAIFGGRWQYGREDRIELARVYFRLCSHLASQGMTVIIAAVAMYEEVREWVRSYIPGALEVYLRVPEDERRRRDTLTKQIYDKVGNVANLYDEPIDPDMIVDNFGDETPDDAAAAIVERFLAVRSRPSADLGRTGHWEAFYAGTKGTLEPSPFARDISGRMAAPVRLLEIGCGNGRDAAFFARLGHAVTALDVSPAAISLCQVTHAGSGAEFMCGQLAELMPGLESPFDAVYSRFCLHAMTRPEQSETLTSAVTALKPGGRLFVEARSINDPMARLGEVISPTERIHGHYRRFIVLDELIAELKANGLDIEEQIEARGLAKFGDEDPTVIRIVGRKP